MNPFIYPTTCDVCGGEGVAMDPSAGWTSKVAHRDPAVCAANIEDRRRREKQKREPKFLENEQGSGV